MFKAENFLNLKKRMFFGYGKYSATAFGVVLLWYGAELCGHGVGTRRQRNGTVLSQVGLGIHLTICVATHDAKFYDIVLCAQSISKRLCTKSKLAKSSKTRGKTASNNSPLSTHRYPVRQIGPLARQKSLGTTLCYLARSVQLHSALLRPAPSRPPASLHPRRGGGGGRG